MHSDAFDRILDESLDRLARGESVEQCVSRYPSQAARLEPLLRVAAASCDAHRIEPSIEATQRARARMASARAARSARNNRGYRTSLFDRLFARPLPLSAVATLAVVALTAVLVVAPALAPQTPAGPTGQPDPGQPTAEPTSPGTPQTPSATTTPAEPTTQPAEPAATTSPDVVLAVPSKNGNFVFYLSDAPNDIGDFQSLTVVVDSIELKPHKGPSVSIIPDGLEVDLTQLQGDLAQEVWRGDVPEGDYKTVLVHVSSVEGILASSGESADVTLPSDTLRISVDFSVAGDDPTDFVFDITVHRSGNAGAGARYILSPQASESGADRPFSPVAQQQGQGDDKDSGQGSQPAEAPGERDNPDAGPYGPGRHPLQSQDDSIPAA